MASHSVPASPPGIARSLFPFAIFYGGMVVIAGVLGNKQVALGALPGVGPIAVEAGIFAFLLLVVTSSAVAELHGRATANRLVLTGFVPLVASMLLIRLVLGLPAAASMQADALAAFDRILGQSSRLMLAGLIAYGTSQTLNVTIFSWLKGREGVRLLWLRAGLASMLSQVVDTLLFITISFYGEFPIRGLLIGQMLAKLVLSAVLVPPAIYLLLWIGRRIDRHG